MSIAINWIRNRMECSIINRRRFFFASLRLNSWNLSIFRNFRFLFGRKRKRRTRQEKSRRQICNQIFFSLSFHFGWNDGVGAAKKNYCEKWLATFLPDGTTWLSPSKKIVKRKKSTHSEPNRNDIFLHSFVKLPATSWEKNQRIEWTERENRKWVGELKRRTMYRKAEKMFEWKNWIVSKMNKIAPITFEQNVNHIVPSFIHFLCVGEKEWAKWHEKAGTEYCQRFQWILSFFFFNFSN